MFWRPSGWTPKPQPGVEAADEASVPISVSEAPAEALPFEDASVDAAVASLVLCSVEHLDRAVAELQRVVKPGGELRFNEHVRSDRRFRGAVQRFADATLWPTLSGGCHLGRQTGAALEAGGFKIERVERFGFRVGGVDPPKSHLLGWLGERDAKLHPWNNRRRPAERLKTSARGET